MIQRTDVYKPLRRFQSQLLMVQSLSWLGVISLLSSNLVLAQTSPPDAAVLSGIDNSKPPVAVAPVENVSNTPQIAPAPARFERLRQQLSPTPAPALRYKSPKTQVHTPPAPQLRSVVRPATNVPSQVQIGSTRVFQKTVSRPTDHNSAYIDPTDYSIGATGGYEAPSRVVVSERSTGCQAVLGQGQRLSGSLCGNAPRRRVRVAVRSTQSINNSYTRPQAVNWVRRSPAVSVASITPARLGPISVSPSGFSVTRRTSLRGQIAIGSMAWPMQSSTNYSPTVQPVDLSIGELSKANTKLTFPLTIPAAITSLFGWRIHPITGDRQFHAGTDLGAPLGTPVLAAYAGNVAVANFLSGYGLAVVLDHKQSSAQTLYAHLSELFVQPGEWVEQGAMIGRVGSTGNSTGPHLHFEVRQQTPEGWVATDPGAQLEYGMAQLVQSLQTASVAPSMGNGG